MAITVPDVCTLPTAEQPPRLAEFEALLTTAVRQVETLTPTHARIQLTGRAGLHTAVRDLTARETRCCSFFTFTVTVEPTTDGEELTLDIRVPSAYTDVLASLTEQAVVTLSSSTGGRPSMRANRDDRCTPAVFARLGDADNGGGGVTRAVSRAAAETP